LRLAVVEIEFPFNMSETSKALGSSYDGRLEGGQIRMPKILSTEVCSD